MSVTISHDFDCCECGVHVIGCVPSPIYPRCGLCAWRPGWWRSAKLRDLFAHDKQWRRDLALRAAAEVFEIRVAMGEAPADEMKDAATLALGRCVICGNVYRHFGHNAEPVAVGRCCDHCNATAVLPARIGEGRAKRK